VDRERYHAHRETVNRETAPPPGGERPYDLAVISSSGWLTALLMSSLFAAPPSRLVERLPDGDPATPKAGSEVIENYCVVEDARQALKIFVVRIEGPGEFRKTFRFPISHEVYRVRAGADGGYPMPTCSFRLGGTSADGLNGTGMNYGVNVIEANRRGVTVSVSMHWDALNNVHGAVDSRLFMPWRTSVRKELSNEVLLVGWFETPKSTPSTVRPGDADTPQPPSP
jgi:hypothetical protein